MCGLKEPLNPVNILTFAINAFRDKNFSPGSEMSEQEKQMAESIIKLLEQHPLGADLSVEVSLDIEQQDADSTDDERNIDTSISSELVNQSACDIISFKKSEPMLSSSDDESYSPRTSSASTYAPSPEKKSKEYIGTDYKRKAVKYWLNEGGRKRLSLSTVRSKFRLVTSQRQLHKWRAQLQNMKANPVECKKKLYENLYARFVETRKNRQSVCDEDLKIWAMEFAHKEAVSNFAASKAWIYNFKRHYRIKSRKITKFVSRSYTKDELELQKSATDFVESTTKKLADYVPSQIFNTDQSGFEKEMRARRTLSFVGEKHTETMAQSINALTHSYTIMPTISMDGMLLPKLFIVLQELAGSFGPTVTKQMFKAENIIVKASKSGKMGRRELTEWYQEAFFPFTEDKCALLLDSWTAYNDSSCLEGMPPGKTIELFQIPPGTTGKIQPLDKFFFRQWKSLYRRLSELLARREDFHFALFQRNNILKLQSFIHYQFSSPRFRDMIKYSWFATGYTSQRPPDFATPQQFCLTKETTTCERGDCTLSVLLRCAWCKTHLCFHHSIECNHSCHTFIA